MAKALPNWINLIVIVFVLFTTIESHAMAENEAPPNAHPWTRSAQFDEVSFTETVAGNIRIHVNAPFDKNRKPARATRLIVYTLPAGNTIEQTLGCRAKPG